MMKKQHNNQREYNTENNRVCYKCKQLKPLTTNHFYKEKDRPFGFGYLCKECCKERKDYRPNRWRNATPEQKASMLKIAKIYSKTAYGRAVHNVNSC